MAQQIRISWYVKNQHTETFTPDEFAQWVADNRLDVSDPTDLDEVYEALDDRGWRSTEALIDLATNQRTWLDTTEAEIADLQSETVAEVTA